MANRIKIHVVFEISSKERFLKSIRMTSHSDTMLGDSERCSICLGPFEQNDEMRVLPCRHGFHTGCVEVWLSMDHTRRCPVCRTSDSSYTINLLEAARLEARDNLMEVVGNLFDAVVGYIRATYELCMAQQPSPWIPPNLITIWRVAAFFTVSLRLAAFLTILMTIFWTIFLPIITIMAIFFGSSIFEL